MMNIKHACEHYEIRTHTLAGAMQDVRSFITGSTRFSPRELAADFIEKALGIAGQKFTNDDEARVTIQAIVEAALMADGDLPDAEATLAAAKERCKKHMSNPRIAFAFVHDDPTSASSETNTVTMAGVEAEVKIKSDGTMKKGGKQVMALALYRSHVLDAETALTNKEFVELLMKELGMSKAGATTYSYMARQQLGEPEGGIVKSKKGRASTH